LELDSKSLLAIAEKHVVEDLTPRFALEIGGETIDTTQPRIDSEGKTRAHPSYKNVKRLGRGHHHYIVQFVGPVKKTWVQGLIRAGAEIAAPFQEFALVVRADNATIRKIAAKREVHWVGHLSHKYRVRVRIDDGREDSRGGRHSRAGKSPNLSRMYVISLFSPKHTSRAASAVKRLRCRILHTDSSIGLIIVDLPQRGLKLQNRLDALAAIHGVKSIRRKPLMSLFNNVAARIINARHEQAIRFPAPPTPPRERPFGNGQGEVIAICDTGLDTGDPDTIHPDFRGRVVQLTSYPINSALNAYVNNPGADDGPADVESGHGTHVAGSALGSGKASEGIAGLNERISGIAPQAKLVLQAVEQFVDWETRVGLSAGHYLAGLPSDLATLLQQARDLGARVHSNSWGTTGEEYWGDYSEYSEQVDDYVWNHQDFCILFAAGNEGQDLNGDGNIDPSRYVWDPSRPYLSGYAVGCVSPPSTAKNCITVGACESERLEFNRFKYKGLLANGPGQGPPFATGPYSDEPMADDPWAIVPFSGRGYTEDGRIKPDVVAPGTFILSAKSTQLPANEQGWLAFPDSGMYFYMGGTSQATPLVAGAVARLREFYRKKHRVQPSAALIKATLVCSAERIADGYVSYFQFPNPHQGFGRVNLNAVIHPARSTRFHFWDVPCQLRVGRSLRTLKSLATGESITFVIDVKSSEAPLRIALAYTDYPGERLVNNLSLSASSGAGEHYYGNASNSRPGFQPYQPSMNNVELISIGEPTVTRWKITVTADNVSHGPQPFALICSGALAQSVQISERR
ncbi:MAG: S8 family serine peptidase, partial [bacterium]